MEFVKYPSLTNSYKQEWIDFCINYGFAKDHVWYVTEKIHGANFAAYVEAGEVRYAKRTAFLSKLENFYNFTYIQGKYEQNLLDLGKHFGDLPVIVYGELCGGWYDGKSTGQKVQKDVNYCPHNEFIVFDIVVNGVALSPMEVQDTCWEFGLIPVPLLFSGSLEHALQYPNAFPTHVPRIFGLMEDMKNICEGVVIKPWPLVRDPYGNLIVFKNKNAKFAESVRTAKPVIAKELTPELQALFDELQPHITENRLNATISKVGNDPRFFAQVRGYFIQDILQDSGVKEKYNGLEQAQRKLIHSELDKIILPMVRKALGVGP